MKKVVNINLGGKPITIDEDAYKVLDKYLNSINRHFSDTDSADDIMYDIEYRIAELFEEQQMGSAIVTLKNVENMKLTMGMPSDFGADHAEEKSTFHQNEKRLFRDPDNKVIAGVASGLTAYYGWDSPLIFRASFILISFSGIGILPYFLLWIFVPKAKTASDRLAMHGEEINIDSIANAVEDSLLDIKDTIEDIGNKVKKKMNQ